MKVAVPLPTAKRDPALPARAARALSTAARVPVDAHLEDEADRCADRAMAMPEPASFRPAAPAAGRRSPPAPGQPLDAATRAFFEPRFRFDFSAVRLHTDGASSASARRLHARAYTVGPDIVLAPGEYRPDTARGRRLLAHELAHVAQQGAAAPFQGLRGPGAMPRPASTGVRLQMAAGFPWQGVVVTETDALMLRATPDVSTPPSQNAVGKLAPGAAVTVLGGSKFTWLKVRGTTTDGASKEGFVQGRYIDDTGGGAEASAAAGIPVSVDRIDIVTGADGAYTGYPAQNTAGGSDMNRPGPFNDPKTGECNNVHQVHFHLDKGDSATVEPVRRARAVWSSAGLETGPGGAPVPPGGMAAQKSVDDGPPPHEVARPSKDKLVVSDTPGTKWLFAGDYPFKADFDFDLTLWWKAGPAIARATYAVAIEKTDAANIPNKTNAVTVKSRQDLVRKAASK